MSSTVNLPKDQIQAYTLARPPVPATPQVTVVYLQPVQVVPASIWTIEITDANGIVHIASYHAAESDGVTEIINGILAAFHLTPPDPFLEDLMLSVDYVSRQLTIVSNGYIIVQASYTPPYPATIWEEMLFPRALADQVIRGAYSDLLKEWGQTDKASVEEQQVHGETQIRESAFETTRNPKLTGQETALSRYKV